LKKKTKWKKNTGRIFLIHDFLKVYLFHEKKTKKTSKGRLKPGLYELAQ
jgi:hypothetical protein